jgi:hypothetical protein
MYIPAGPPIGFSGTVFATFGMVLSFSPGMVFSVVLFERALFARDVVARIVSPGCVFDRVFVSPEFCFARFGFARGFVRPWLFPPGTLLFVCCV